MSRMYNIVQTTFLLGPAANGASSIAASRASGSATWRRA